jgi:hypothetical protein
VARREAASPDEERHADRLLVGQELALGKPVLAQEEAVVRGEDDHRVLDVPGLFEGPDQTLDQVVHGEERGVPRPVDLDHVLDALLVELRPPLQVGRLVFHVRLVERRLDGEALLREGPLVAGRGERLRGDPSLAFEVRRERGHHQEERLALAHEGAEDALGLGREHVRLVVLLGAAVGDGHAVFAYLIVVIAVGGGVQKPEPP